MQRFLKNYFLKYCSTAMQSAIVKELHWNVYTGVASGNTFYAINQLLPQICKGFGQNGKLTFFTKENIFITGQGDFG